MQEKLEKNKTPPGIILLHCNFTYLPLSRIVRGGNKKLNFCLFKNYEYFFHIFYTQGVLASKFPISILRRIQGQDGRQIVRKIV